MIQLYLKFIFIFKFLSLKTFSMFQRWLYLQHGTHTILNESFVFKFLVLETLTDLSFFVQFKNIPSFLVHVCLIVILLNSKINSWIQLQAPRFQIMFIIIKILTFLKNNKNQLTFEILSLLILWSQMILLALILIKFKDIFSFSPSHHRFWIFRKRLLANLGTSTNSIQKCSVYFEVLFFFLVES